MSENLKASDGSLFLQLKAGGRPEYVGCADLDAIPEPAGDQTLTYCRDGDGNFKVVGSSQGVPGAVTTAIKALVFPESSILDELGGCLVNLYVLQKNCGKLGVFTNYVRGTIVHHARVTSRSIENAVMREAGDPTIQTVEFSGWNPAYRVRQVTVTRQSIAETTPLNTIVTCSNTACESDCGPASALGDSMFAGGEAPAGSPADRADVWQTDDAGATWTNIAGGAAHPFLSGEDIKAAGCFWLDRLTTRWLVARGQVVAEPLKVAYSDDGGATWTLITVGNTNNEGALGAGSLMVLDREHMWLATSAGNIYFSDDSGITWTVEAAAVIADAGAPLNAIKFADSENGVAVGNTDTVISTIDGGATWSVITSPTTSDNVTAVWVFSKYRWIIGSNADGLFQTWDGGATWEAKTFTGQGSTGTVVALAFANDLVGFMLHNTVVPVGSVHRTIDGGHTWEKLSTPTNTGLNAIFAASENKAFAAGNASGGTAVVLKVSG